MSENHAHPSSLLSPDEMDVALRRYHEGQVVQIEDGQNFIVAHVNHLGMVLVPITASAAETLCSSVDPTTTDSPVN